MTELFRRLKNSLSRPEEWEVTRYEIKHKKSGLVIWTSNGWMFLESSPDSLLPLPLSKWECFRIWPHVKRLRSKVVAQKLDKVMNDLCQNA